MAICTGDGEEHCCWVDGQPCEYLETDSVPGRRWVCGLRRELGSWDAVHSDIRYIPIRTHFVKVGVALCGDWQPRPDQCCQVK